MNRVMLIGRLTAKPELRYTGSNLPFARFSVAVNRTFNNAQGQRETDFINVVVWRKQAENVCNFLNKGSLVSVEGRLQTGSYDDKDGNKRYTMDVVADSVQFLESKAQSQNRVNDNVTPADFAFDNNSASTTDMSEEVFSDFGDSIEISDDDIAF